MIDGSNPSQRRRSEAGSAAASDGKTHLRKLNEFADPSTFESRYLLPWCSRARQLTVSRDDAAVDLLKQAHLRHGHREKVPRHSFIHDGKCFEKP